MTYISRDPFTRQELHREVVPVVSQACDWCGNVRHRKKGDVYYLYQYRTEPDAGRPATHRGLFCSKPCHDAYHA